MNLADLAATTISADLITNKSGVEIHKPTTALSQYKDHLSQVWGFPC